MDTRQANLSIGLFGVLIVAALVLVPLSSALLPPLVASHFDLAGEPTAYLARGVYVALMTAADVGVPLLVVASIAWRVMRRPQGLNIPHRAHWMAPERIQDTANFITLHTVRFASMLIVLLGVAHVLVLRANLLRPPHLALGPMLAALAVFVIGTAIWLRALWARFPGPGARG